MDIMWRDDEGYELFYHCIQERYGYNGAYNNAWSELREEISRLHGKMQQIQNAEKHKLDTLHSYSIQAEELKSRSVALEGDLDKQRKHYDIERKVEFEREIQRIEKELSQLADESRIVLEKKATLESESVEKFDGVADLEHAVKAMSYLAYDTAVNSNFHPPVPRNLGSAECFDPDVYSGMMARLGQRMPDCLYLYERSLMYREEDHPSADWPVWCQQAAEIASVLPSRTKFLRCINDRWFLDYGSGLVCVLSAVRIKHGGSEDVHIAIENKSESGRHPVFTDLGIRLPRDFIVFTSDLLIRHSFKARVVGLGTGGVRIQDDDDL